MTDWKLPIQVKSRDGWVDVMTVTISKSNPEYAAMTWYDEDTTVRCWVYCCNDIAIRNVPAAPKLVALSDDELLQRWGWAFRRRGCKAIVRMNITDTGPMIGSVVVKGEAMLEYDAAPTPWLPDSWLPCGRVTEGEWE